MKEFSKVAIDAIHVGSCFSEPVYFEDGVNMFLPAEKPAKQYHVDVLKKWKIPYLLTRGTEVKAPAGDAELLDILEDA